MFDNAGRFVYAEFSWHDVHFALGCVYGTSVTQIEMRFSCAKIGKTETPERSDGALRTEAEVFDAGGMEF